MPRKKNVFDELCVTLPFCLVALDSNVTISNIHQFSLSLSNSQFSGLQRPPLSPSAELWLRICQSFELPNQATRKLFVHHITSHHFILHFNRTATSQMPRGQPGTWRARVSSSSSCSTGVSEVAEFAMLRRKHRYFLIG